MQKRGSGTLISSSVILFVLLSAVRSAHGYSEKVPVAVCDSPDGCRDHRHRRHLPLHQQVHLQGR